MIIAFALSVSAPLQVETIDAPPGSGQSASLEQLDAAALLYPRETMQRVNLEYQTKFAGQAIEGDVGVTMVASDSGEPISCQVSQSSGHAMLDDLACRSMMRFARFAPARDSAGTARASRWSARISFRLS